MILKPVILEALRSLRLYPFRSALALAGIAVGIGSVVAMVASTAMVRETAGARIGEMGGNTLRIELAPQIMDMEKWRSQVQVLQAIPDHCPEVERIALVVMAPGVNVVRGLTGMQYVFGTTPDLLPAAGLVVAGGRFLHALDGERPVCVVGAGVAKALGMEREDAVGRSIILNGQYLSVVGELEASEASSVTSSHLAMDSAILIPLPLLCRLYGVPGRPVGLAMVDGDPESARTAVTEYLERCGIRKAEVQTAEDMIDLLASQNSLLDKLLALVSAISMAVGGIGVMNVMLVSVAERGREIGIRRALGARQLDVLVQFLAESVVLCAVGGLAGVGVGLVLVQGIAGKYHLLSASPLGAIWAGCAVSLGTGLFFGMYPAAQAARLDPVSVLQTE